MLIEDSDFLSNDEIESYNKVVTGSSFPWFINLKTATGYDYSITGEEEDTILIHTAYCNGIPNSEYYVFFKEIFDKFCKKNNLDYRAILRMRLNLLFSRENQVPSGAHVDYVVDHNVFLYYFDNSDGDTVFYNEMAELGQLSPSKELVELFKSSPSAGKGIVFDGKRFHSPTPPKNARFRITLNIDFV